MGTFIFKSKRVRKETFSSLFSYSVLLLSFFILIGCGGGSDGGGSSNGTGTSASFRYPRGITTDGTNLYVADYSNHLIRKIE